MGPESPRSAVSHRATLNPAGSTATKPHGSHTRRERDRIVPGPGIARKWTYTSASPDTPRMINVSPKDVPTSGWAAPWMLLQSTRPGAFRLSVPFSGKLSCGSLHVDRGEAGAPGTP